MTFIYELDRYPLEIYRMCENELTMYVKAFESYRIRDVQTDKRHRNYIPLRFAGGHLTLNKLTKAKPAGRSIRAGPRFIKSPYRPALPLPSTSAPSPPSAAAAAAAT